MTRSVILAFALVGCAGGGDDTTEPSGEAGGLFDGMVVEVVATADDGLDQPSDIEFQPGTGKAFIMNRQDDSLVILHDPSNSDDPDADRRGGENDVVGANHFLARPSGLAFSSDGNWASIHMEDKKTQGFGGTPADFMGPTLWTGDTSILDGGHATHLDMLHNSPEGAGIAWKSDGPSINTYYVFDGWNESITFYDFNEDHGLGGADHSDATIHRCLEGEVSYVEDTVSHLVYDEGLLYIVDTGNNRILAMDTTTGALGNPLAPAYDGLGRDKFNYMDAVDFWVMIDTEAAGMEEPAGMELHDGIVYVTDHAQGYVYAFDLISGDLLDSLDLEVGGGALQGMGIDEDGTLWFTNEDDDEVFKLVAE